MMYLYASYTRITLSKLLSFKNPERKIVADGTFEPTGLGLSVFTERYAKDGTETWQEACLRVARAVSAAEENGKAQTFEDRFYQQLTKGLFMPGGRIWYSAGRKMQQMLNCVSGDTLVHTDLGLIPARELNGKTVSVLSEGGTYRLAQWSEYGEQELFTVIFANGDEIQATAGHEWLVSKSKGETERVTTESLTGRHVPMQHRAVHTLDPYSYRGGVQHGLVYGDGAIHSDGKAYILQFGDSKHLVEEYFDKYTMQRHARYPEGVMYSGSLSPLLKKEIPNLADVGSSYIFGFIAGYIAADGNVDDRGTVTLHSASFEDLVSVRTLASSIGIPTVSIKCVREKNPWTGEDAPLWCLRFARSGIDSRLILKQSHKDKWAKAPTPGKKTTVRVVAVVPTGQVEPVYCCDEPETHTWVAGAGYLTGNCFVIGTGDSREAWGKSISDMLITSGVGGGVGANFSPVRGRGYAVGGTGGIATGAVSLMQMWNKVGDELVSGGGRRLALMLCLNIDHPDIEEFLNVKLDLGQLNNANISIVLPPHISSEEFQRLVREDGEIELRFAGLADKFERTIKARELWHRLVQNAWQSGEPGVLNSHLANQQNNVFYHWPLVSTNPCAELWLPVAGCCDLGALVLPRFVVDNRIDWDALDETVRLGVRFLDDVLTVNHYPLPEIKQVGNEERRIGLGVMGLHSMLLDLGLRYSSAEGHAMVDKLFAFIKHTAYDASINLAIEKGAFPAYDPQLLQSGFMKTMKRGIRNKVKEHGIRNCAMLTIAPTGTTAMVQGVTGGIEPLFSPVYIRRRKKIDEMAREYKAQTLVISQEYLDHPDIVEGAYDIHPAGHIEIQKIVQKHIDNAVSKTINLPQEFNVDELADLWLEYLPYMKGSTFYRQGSRGEEPMQHVPVSEVDTLLRTWDHEIEYEAPESMECPGGACALDTPKKIEVASE